MTSGADSIPCVAGVGPAILIIDISIIALFIQNIFKLLKEKMSSLFFCSPKITHPRPQIFSVNSAIICSRLHFWHLFDVIGSIICSGLHFWGDFYVISSIWQNSFQIWSTAAGYGELCVWFQPIRMGKYFEWIIIYYSSLFLFVLFFMT